MSRREYSTHTKSSVLALVSSAALAFAALAKPAFAQDGGAKVGTPAQKETPQSESKVIGPSPAPAPQAKSTGRTGLKAPPLNFAPPEASFEEPVFDWGSVLQGEVVVHEFEIKNTGGSPLKVERVKPACGCTTVDYDKVIAPGKVGRSRSRSIRRSSRERSRRRRRCRRTRAAPRSV